MAIYKAIITAVTKINDTLRVEATLYKDSEQFPMKTLELNAATATKDEAVTLIKDELTKLKSGYSAEATLKTFVGQEVNI